MRDAISSMRDAISSMKGIGFYPYRRPSELKHQKIALRTRSGGGGGSSSSSGGGGGGGSSSGGGSRCRRAAATLCHSSGSGSLASPPVLPPHARSSPPSTTDSTHTCTHEFRCHNHIRQFEGTGFTEKQHLECFRSVSSSTAGRWYHTLKAL